MIRSRRTEIGWMSEAMAGAGNRRSWSSIAVGRRISIVDAGFIRIAAGIGCRIIRGVGRHSIMAGGSNMRRSVGAGALTVSGVRHGSAGGTMAIFAVGLLCRPEQDSLPESASHSTVIPRDAISILD